MKIHRFLSHATTGSLILCYAATAHASTVGVTGGDAGQGLTIEPAAFAKALNVGTATPQTIQGALFAASPNAGFTITGVEGLGNYTGNFAFGAGETSANDTALVNLTKILTFGPKGINITINSLTPETLYRIELLQSVMNFASREQAILLDGVFQENVPLNTGNFLRNTTINAVSNSSGQISIGLRPSATYGGAGPQDGAVLNGIAVTTLPPVDFDNDQLSDLWEYKYFPADLTKLSGSGDFDSDGANDLAEFQASSNPTIIDTDGDGLGDGAELNRKIGGNPAPTNPSLRDTDSDGLYDNEETNTGTFVSAINTGTNPLVADSDADGVPDQSEILRGSNPNQAGSLPTGPAASALVVLNASGLPAGPLTTWTSSGLISRDFQATTATKPSVTIIQGVKGVTFEALASVMKGPLAPSILTGGSSRTVEAWIYNPAPAVAEAVVTWGRRDGPDGTLSGFIHGTSPDFGAFAGWGSGPDVGWGSIPPKGGRWTHVAYTYNSVGGSFKVYADGVLANQETKNLNTFANDNLDKPLSILLAGQNNINGTIGGDPASLSIARLTIHDRALSPAELLANDTDSDGMRDDFEVFYGLDPNSTADANADPDGDGVTSLAECRIGTSPVWANPDTDADGLFDEWELRYFRNAAADPAETDAQVLAKYDGTGLEADPDFDGFDNRGEFLGGSNPTDGASQPTDQDGDGMVDAWEIQNLGSILAAPYADDDSDGSFNIDEFLGNTPEASDWATDASNPSLETSQPDKDGNTIGDGWETKYFLGAGTTDLTADPDLDGLTNQAEYLALTDPNKADTDDDTIHDIAELNRMAGGVAAPTNPRKADTDADGLLDPFETNTGIYVSSADTGSNPRVADSDGDTFADGLEVVRKSNPNSSGSTPAAFSLIAHWRMNETSGTAVPAIPDAAFTGTFGNVAGQQTNLAWQPAAGIGGALQITTSTDRVEIPPVNTTYGFTAMGWVKPGAIADMPAWARLIVSRFQTGFFLGREGDSLKWKFIVKDDFSLSGGTIVPDVWQHVCGTYDGVTARLYVNGIEVGSKPMAPPSIPVQPVFFGPETPNDRNFLGLTDEFKIYSGAMPTGEIASLYSAESALFGGGASPYVTWATGFGLDPNTNGAASADPDNDGTINQVEFALGLSPVNGSSRFQAITSGTPAAGLIITWPSKAGITFQVRSGTDLQTFPTLEATIPAAANPATTTSWSSGPLAPGGRKFYRVEFSQ